MRVTEPQSTQNDEISMDLHENLEGHDDGGNYVLNLGWGPLPWERSSEDRYGAAGALLTFLPSTACGCADCDAALSTGGS